MQTKDEDEKKERRKRRKKEKWRSVKAKPVTIDPPTEKKCVSPHMAHGERKRTRNEEK